MGFLSAIGKLAAGAANLLFGTSIGKGGGETAKGVSTIADKILPMSDRENLEAEFREDEAIQQDTESARAFKQEDMQQGQLIQPQGLIPFLFMWLLEAVNKIVDALNHAIRPVGFIWLAGGLSGWWKLPEPGMVDPFWQKAFWITLTFFYGGRTLVKDILPLVGTLHKK